MVYFIMKKKGQVTYFIIVGLIILIIIGLFVSFLRTQETVTSTSVDEFKKVRFYVENFLEQHAEHSIILVGRHGGYIGSIESLNHEPYAYEYGGNIVATGIGNVPRNSYGQWFKRDYHYAEPVKTYPWSGFSTPDGSHFSETYKVGKPLLPPLERTTARSSTTVKREIETYVEEMVKSANIRSLFEREFDIKTSENPNATVVFGAANTFVFLEYEINLSTKNQVTRKTMNDYVVEIPIGFRDFYNFIEETVYYDVSDLRYRVSDVSHYEQLPSFKTDYRVSLDKDTVGSSDMITFVYNDTEIGDYYFRIFRENRIPAIYDLVPKTYEEYDSLLGEYVDVEYDLDGVDLNKHNFGGTSNPFTHKTYSDGILNYIRSPQGIDPDGGDVLTFTYGLASQGPLCPDPVSVSVNEDSGDFTITCPDYHINLENYTCDMRVYVSDQHDVEPKDYDDLTFQYTCDECIGNTNRGVCV